MSLEIKVVVMFGHDCNILIIFEDTYHLVSGVEQRDYLKLKGGQSYQKDI